MWTKQVLCIPERILKRPAEVSVPRTVTRERERMACVHGAHVCVYKVVGGWSEYQRELGRMDALRTGLPLLKTPVKNTYNHYEL